MEDRIPHWIHRHGNEQVSRLNFAISGLKGKDQSRFRGNTVPKEATERLLSHVRQLAERKVHLFIGGAQDKQALIINSWHACAENRILLRFPQLNKQTLEINVFASSLIGQTIANHHLLLGRVRGNVAIRITCQKINATLFFKYYDFSEKSMGGLLKRCKRIV